jgi:hypothetical protein
MAPYQLSELEYEKKIQANKERYKYSYFKPGMKIWFKEEKRSYTIRACNERYLVCTKPYNFRKETVIYSMVDLWEGIRGRDGYVFSPYSYYTQEDCDAYLKELINGEASVSRRGCLDVHIVKVK